MANGILKPTPKHEVAKSYEELRKTEFYFNPAYTVNNYWREYKIAPELITAYYTGIRLEALEKMAKSGLVKQFFCTPDIRLAERYLTGEIEKAHLGPPPARIETRSHITGEIVLVYDKGALTKDYSLGSGEGNANEYDIRRKGDSGGPAYGPSALREEAGWGIPFDSHHIREVIAYSDHAYREASRMLQSSGIKVTRMGPERNAAFWKTEKYLQLGVTPEETETIYAARRLRYGFEAGAKEIGKAAGLLVDAIEKREAAGTHGKTESFIYTELADCLFRQMGGKVSMAKVEKYKQEKDRKTPGWSAAKAKEDPGWEQRAADTGMFESKYTLSDKEQEKAIGKELIDEYRALIAKAKELNPENNLAAERPLPA